MREKTDTSMATFDSRSTYCRAPVRSRISVIMVRVTERQIENAKAMTLLSNHHQKAIHRKARMNVKWRSL